MVVARRVLLVACIRHDAWHHDLENRVTAIVPPPAFIEASAPLDRPLYGATFWQSVSRFFRNYVNFSGRASRSEFWWAYLFQSIIGFVAGIVLSFLMIVVVVSVFAAHPEAYAAGTTDAESAAAAAAITVEAFIAVFWVNFIGLAVITLPLLLPWIAVVVRRLHDTNRSGWWYLLTLVPFAGYLVLIFAALESDPAGSRFDARRSLDRV